MAMGEHLAAFLPSFDGDFALHAGDYICSSSPCPLLRNTEPLSFASRGFRFHFGIRAGASASDAKNEPRRGCKRASYGAPGVQRKMLDMLNPNREGYDSDQLPSFLKRGKGVVSVCRRLFHGWVRDSVWNVSNLSFEGKHRLSPIVIVKVGGICRRDSRRINRDDMCRNFFVGRARGNRSLSNQHSF